MVRVLIVEDDAAIRETLSAVLRGDDVEVTLCDGATKAAQVISGSDFDLVITDMRMETPTSGCDVIRAARSSACPPPIVVLTAFPLPRSDVRTKGATSVLLKGSDSFALIRNIRKLVADIAAHKASPPPCANPDQRKAGSGD